MKNNEDPIIVGDKIKLTQRGKRNIWTADYWHNSKHYRRSLRTRNLKQATAEATKLAARLIEGNLVDPIKKYLVDQAVNDFLDHMRLNQRAKKTLSQYECHFNLWRCYLLKNGISYLQQVLPIHFDGFRRTLPATVGPRTIHNYFRSVNALMRWAKRNRRISDNTLEEMRVPKPRPPAKPVPSMMEVNRILQLARKQDLPIFAMAAFTGARIGDIRTRFVEDLDLNAGWIHFRARPGAAPKGGKERKVPVHTRLGQILKDLPKHGGKWLFVADPSRKFPAGDHHINDKHINERFQAIVRKLGMKSGREDGYTFHSLRRFFETHCVHERIPQRIIDAWMGHSSDRSMGSYYYGLRDEESQRFMKQLKFPLKN